MELLLILAGFAAKKIVGILIGLILVSMGTTIQSVFKSIKEEFHKFLGYETATVLGNIFIGAILGGVSLVFIPRHITPNIQIRIINLVITPFVIGALVNLSSNIKFYKNPNRFDLINFVSGYTFALAWAGMRFIFAN